MRGPWRGVRVPLTSKSQPGAVIHHGGGHGPNVPRRRGGKRGTHHRSPQPHRPKSLLQSLGTRQDVGLGGGALIRSRQANEPESPKKSPRVIFCCSFFLGAATREARQRCGARGQPKQGDAGGGSGLGARGSELRAAGSSGLGLAARRTHDCGLAARRLRATARVRVEGRVGAARRSGTQRGLGRGAARGGPRRELRGGDGSRDRAERRWRSVRACEATPTSVASVWGVTSRNLLGRGKRWRRRFGWRWIW